MNKLLRYFHFFNTESPDVGGVTDAVSQVNKFAWEVTAIVVPLIAGLAGILMMVKLISLAIKLSQVSEEPEERSRMIKGMIWWGIGLLLCIIAATVTPTVIFNLLGQIKSPEFPTGGGE